MLELRKIRKSYLTGDFMQVALDDVSIAFRDNEFVAVLGPSGSGKTTLLNIVGGLDRYESGSLIIDGIDTSNYTDRDWDTYRNNRIGFVFQSYNLIPHQSVLSNVELALTLAGVSKAERRQRAQHALDEVGLLEHANKRPSQLSGGQMQRVAIARALINDPEILLADEPTGALDSTTSVQIMNLLAEIAKDRLVVMVTHNPELAQTYATRTVDLSDGRVDQDSRPFDPASEKDASKMPKRRSMGFLTAIALSFNNLMTKKGRTLMTAFAGSIGIIGIATILALANGVNNYIKSIEEDTLSVYPLTVQSTGLDMAVMLGAASEVTDTSTSPTEQTGDGFVAEARMLNRMFASVGSNDLAALKLFLDNDGGNIDSYTSLIQYTYNVTPQIFVDTGPKFRQVNPDSTFASFGVSADNPMAASMRTDQFNEMVDDSSLVEEQYDVVAGSWPTQHDELLLVLTPTGKISDLLLYNMGIKDPAELDSMMKQLMNQEPIDMRDDGPLQVSYEELLSTTFKMVPASQFYEFDETYEVWTSRAGDSKRVKELAANGETLRISGVAQVKSGVSAAALTPGFYYLPSLTSHLIEEASSSPVVQAQLKTPRINVLTGRSFAQEEEERGSDFDMSKLMTIDEEAIQAAFEFDEQQLSFDPGALNIAGMSLPEMNLDPSALPKLDVEDMMGDFEMDMGDIDLQEILAGIDFNIEDVDLGIDAAAVAAIGAQMAQAYGDYCGHLLDPTQCATDPEGTFADFLGTPEGEALNGQLQELFDGAQAELEAAQEQIAQQMVAAITQAIQEQMVKNTAAMEAQLQAAMSQYMAQVMGAISTQVTGEIQNQMLPALQAQIAASLQDAMSSVFDNMADVMSIDPQKFQDAFEFNMGEEELAAVVGAMMAGENTSFENNMAKFGWANFAKPSGIDIYPKDFESKEAVVAILDQYNDDMVERGQDEKVITYTDLVGVLMSSVTTIINVVSYVLVAFVAISLVVSSIMIGVITYISVLERRKEIGILRSIGASKRDIKRVFNAETLIVGFVAGLLGIGVTILLTIPANIFVHSKWGISGVATLPWQAAVILVAISMGLTYLAGLIPASAASRKDPVEALRSD